MNLLMTTIFSALICICSAFAADAFSNGENRLINDFAQLTDVPAYSNSTNPLPQSSNLTSNLHASENIHANESATTNNAQPVWTLLPDATTAWGAARNAIEALDAYVTMTGTRIMDGSIPAAQHMAELTCSFFTDNAPNQMQLYTSVRYTAYFFTASAIVHVTALLTELILHGSIQLCHATESLTWWILCLPIWTMLNIWTSLWGGTTSHKRAPSNTRTRGRRSRSQLKENKHNDMDTPKGEDADGPKGKGGRRGRSQAKEEAKDEDADAPKGKGGRRGRSQTKEEVDEWEDMSEDEKDTIEQESKLIRKMRAVAVSLEQKAKAKIDTMAEEVKILQATVAQPQNQWWQWCNPWQYWPTRLQPPLPPMQYTAQPAKTPTLVRAYSPSPLQTQMQTQMPKVPQAVEPPKPAPKRTVTTAKLEEAVNYAKASGGPTAGKVLSPAEAKKQFPGLELNESTQFVFNPTGLRMECLFQALAFQVVVAAFLQGHKLKYDMVLDSLRNGSRTVLTTAKERGCITTGGSSKLQIIQAIKQRDNGMSSDAPEALANAYIIGAEVRTVDKDGATKAIFVPRPSSEEKWSPMPLNLIHLHGGNDDGHYITFLRASDSLLRAFNIKLSPEAAVQRLLIDLGEEGDHVDQETESEAKKVRPQKQKKPIELSESSGSSDEDSDGSSSDGKGESDDDDRRPTNAARRRQRIDSGTTSDTGRRRGRRGKRGDGRSHGRQSSADTDGSSSSASQTKTVRFGQPKKVRFAKETATTKKKASAEPPPAAEKRTSGRLRAPSRSI